MKEVRFLMYAVKSVHTDLYTDNHEIQQGLLATLEIIFQALLCEEQKEKEDTRVLIEIARKRWPDILNEEQKEKEDILSPAKFTKAVSKIKKRKSAARKAAKTRLDNWRKSMQEIEP